MGYRSLHDAVVDLEKHGQLVRLDDEIDAHLEAAEIQRRVFAAGGPAVLYTRVKGCAFPMLSNAFGTMDRVRFLFRDSLESVRLLVDAKVDPGDLARQVTRAVKLPAAAMHLIPLPVSTGAVLAHATRISALPQVVSWPDDGGPFITLPQVFTEDPDAPGLRHSNLGMYRVQLAGNDYERDREVGLHYQIHRGIGVHHAAAIRRGERLRVNVFVGGPPAMTVAAVMPLPEGLPEIAFAGALNHRAIRMIRPSERATRPSERATPLPSIHADADFCITGWIDPGVTKAEGPFGDHLGYYAKAHDFPVLRVDRVTHREGAIWPFTTVGRPPQEDTMFGALIRELTGPLIPTVLPGVKEVHAVDEAGVHPLLLALGSERYTPYASVRRPMEILTQANAILGQGQMSLAKYLIIAAHEDAPTLRLDDIAGFFQHVLERLDPTRDLHFHVNTTMDTLDYSGTGMNRGSKLVIAVAGEKRRQLARELPASLSLPAGFSAPAVCMPGVLAMAASSYGTDRSDVARLCASFEANETLVGFPLVVVTDDSEFCARSIANFVWVTFTRSDPAADVDGVGSFQENKAWGCRGSIVIDARRKPQHAAPLVEDREISRRVDALFARGGPLSRWG